MIGGFSDHYANDDPNGDPYLPNTNCEWVINTGSLTPTVITLDRHQVQQGLDLITIYDGAPSTLSILYVYSDDGFPMNPIVSTSGLITVQFTSNGNTQMTGFSLIWTSFEICPNNCNFNGYCILDRCKCVNGWSGVDCSQVSILIPLYPGAPHSDYVDEYEWKFFYVDILEPYQSLVVDSAHLLYPGAPAKPRWGGGHPVFFLRRNYFPTRTEFDAHANYYDNGNANSTGLTIINPPLGRYAVGVQGLEASGFYLLLNPFVLAPAVKSPPAANNRSGGFIAGMFFLALGIVAIIGILIAVGIWYKRKRSGMTFREMQDKN